MSPRLEDHLHETLGRPTTCPHGNPFPGSPDEERLLGARRMTETRAGESVVVWRITEEGEDDNELLHFAHDNGVLPGTTALVEEVDLRGGHVRLSASDRAVTIPTRWAQHIRVSGPVSG